MQHTILRSTGIYVPEIELTNDALRQRFAKSDPEFIDKMEAATGIKTRWYVPDDWATSDIAVRAGQAALKNAGLTPDDLDLLLVGTDCPDYLSPATSTVVQGKLGAKKAGTFDVGCACASFPTALATAHGLMATNKSIRRTLVIGVYLMHRLADPKDTGIFFYGDGAGAAVLEPSSQPGILGATMRADGAYAKHWGIYSGGTAEPASEESVRAGRTHVKMLERFPPEVNDEGWPIVVRTLAKDQGFAVRDIDFVIFTQVRNRTIEKVMAALELPMERTHMIMDKWGYTGSACIPMALHDALLQGKLKPGQLLVLVGSGVGYNQAGIAMRVSEEMVRNARR
jgi:3-oxoacyl-[acyl-carrier-protein] synthase-3